MKSVFISYTFQDLIITEITIDRNLGTDYEKRNSDKKLNIDFHLDAFLNNFIEIDFYSFLYFLVLLNLF